MRPPYGSEEVAPLVLAALESAGVEGAEVTVTADTRSRSWSVAARWPGGEARASYPFADATGIHTPREIAAWFLAETGLG